MRFPITLSLSFLLTLNVTGQTDQNSFSFDEIVENGKGINVAPQHFESKDELKINFQFCIQL